MVLSGTTALSYLLFPISDKLKVQLSSWEVLFPVSAVSRVSDIDGPARAMAGVAAITLSVQGSFSVCLLAVLSFVSD